MKKCSLGIVLVLATLLLSACGSSSSEDGASVSPEPASPTPTPVADTTLADMVGIYSTACVATANIDGTAAYKLETLQISSDGTYAYLIKYYPLNTCTGTVYNYVYSPGTVAVVSATTSPANGHLLAFTITGTTIATSSSTAGRDHLNTACATSSFNLNGGISVSSDYTCSGDSRYTTKGNGTVGYAAVVNNTVSLSFTALAQNLPGILTQNSVATATSVTFIK